MVSPMQRKLAVEMVVSMRLSGRKWAYRVIGLARSSAYYQSAPLAIGLTLYFPTFVGDLLPHARNNHGIAIGRSIL